MTSFIVLLAVLSLTVNMALHVAAQDNDTSVDEDHTDYEEDATSQEDLDQNLNNSLLTQINSSSVTTPPDETEADISDPVVHVASGSSDLELDSSAGDTHISTDMSLQSSPTVTPFQTLTASGHQVRRFDLSQVPESVEQMSSVAISEMSVIQGVPEGTTSLGFSSRLSDPAIFLFQSSLFINSERVTFEFEASTAATDETVSSLTLHDSFLPSIHETSFHWSRSSEGHQHLRTSSVFDEFQEVVVSFLSTTEHAELTSIEHPESTATGQAESTVAEHAESTSIEHAESTSIEHAESTSIEHLGPTSTEHAESTSTEHAEPTSTEHAESTSTEHAEPTSTEHAESTSTEHAESTSTEHAESTSTEHAESTSTEHAESTSTEHAESTSTEHAEPTSTEHAEPTSTEHAESTSIEHAEATSVDHPESTAAEQAEYLSRTAEILRSSSQPSLQGSSLTPSVGFSAGPATSNALISTDTPSNLVSSARRTTVFVRLSRTDDRTSVHGEFSQADETAEREFSTFVSSHECSSCSSLEHSPDDIASTRIHAMRSSTFPSDMYVQTSTFDMSLTSSHFDTKLTLVVDTGFHTASLLVGSEIQFPSTVSLLPVPTQSLPTSWDIRVSSEETTQATTSLYALSMEHTSSSHIHEDSPRPHITSSFYSSLYLTQGGGFSSENVLHSEELVTSRYDTANVSDILLSSLQDTSSGSESIVVSTYDMSHTSDISSSFGYDRIHASESINTSIHDSRHALEENDTSRYHVLHTMEEIDTSRYETLHTGGSSIAASDDFSSHRLVQASSTLSEDLEQSVVSELPETPSEQSQGVPISVYSASLIPASSTSRGTSLLLTTSVRASYLSVTESISVLSQWDSGRTDVGVASLSQILTSIPTMGDAVTSGQGLSVTPFATTFTGSEWIALTSTFLETSFSFSTILKQFSTSIQIGILTSTTSLLTTTTPKATNTTASITTKEYTTPHFETSTEIIHKIISNFTIAIYFDGDCEKANEKKYTSILKAKMFQFIQNVTQIDDKSGVFIGHVRCNPSRIPITFVHADRTLVFLYLNDTFSNSPRYLRIHSMVLKLTGYSEEPDAQKRKGESEITPIDITIFATASCICLVLIIAGLAIFAREIYHKKYAHRFSRPGSLGMPLKTETLALRSIPTNKSDYKHVEMNEEAFVNEAYSSRGDDEYSSVASERKTTFPSSEPNSPEEPRDATRSKKASEKNSGSDTRSSVSSSVSISNGTNRHESPGYGLIIGLMGYTKRLERQQQRKQHQQQQQKLQFEESSYYAVPQKRSKPPKNQENTQTKASATPASYTPASRPETIEDSPIPPPRHLRTLHEVNELYESNEELVPFTTHTNNSSNPISRTDTGLDNPSFLRERGHVDSTDVFHF